MKRQVALLLATILLAGCRSPTAAIDPFVGTYTVPPPGTNHSSLAPPPNSYYNAPPPGATSQRTPDRLSPPGNDYSYSRSGTSQGTSRASVSGSDSRGLDTQAVSIPVRTTNPGERPARSSSGDRRPPPASGFQVNNNPPIRVVEPVTTAANRGNSLPSSRAGFTPRSSNQQPPARESQSDIMNLPAGQRSPPPSTSSGFRPVGSVVRASYEEQASADDAEAQDRRVTRRTAPISQRSQRSYGFDAGYAWLQGKLEYSRVDRRWKLRYIPIDGDTDEFGGSVFLRGARLLEDFQPGDFVTVYGVLGEEDTDRGSFSAAYQIDRIEPLQ